MNHPKLNALSSLVNYDSDSSGVKTPKKVQLKYLPMGKKRPQKHNVLMVDVPTVEQVKSKWDEKVGTNKGDHSPEEDVRNKNLRRSKRVTRYSTEEEQTFEQSSKGDRRKFSPQSPASKEKKSRETKSSDSTKSSRSRRSQQLDSGGEDQPLKNSRRKLPPDIKANDNSAKYMSYDQDRSFPGNKEKNSSRNDKHSKVGHEPFPKTAGKGSPKTDVQPLRRSKRTMSSDSNDKKLSSKHTTSIVKCSQNKHEFSEKIVPEGPAVPNKKKSKHDTSSSSSSSSDSSTSDSDSSDTSSSDSDSTSSSSSESSPHSKAKPTKRKTSEASVHKARPIIQDVDAQIRSNSLHKYNSDSTNVISCSVDRDGLLPREKSKPSVDRYESSSSEEDERHRGQNSRNGKLNKSSQSSKKGVGEKLQEGYRRQKSYDADKSPTRMSRSRENEISTSSRSERSSSKNKSTNQYVAAKSRERMDDGSAKKQSYDYRKSREDSRSRTSRRSRSQSKDNVSKARGDRSRRRYNRSTSRDRSRGRDYRSQRIHKFDDGDNEKDGYRRDHSAALNKNKKISESSDDCMIIEPSPEKAIAPPVNLPPTSIDSIPFPSCNIPLPPEMQAKIEQPETQSVPKCEEVVEEQVPLPPAEKITKPVIENKPKLDDSDEKTVKMDSVTLKFNMNQKQPITSSKTMQPVSVPGKIAFSMSAGKQKIKNVFDQGSSSDEEKSLSLPFTPAMTKIVSKAAEKKDAPVKEPVNVFSTFSRASFEVSSVVADEEKLKEVNAKTKVFIPSTTVQSDPVPPPPPSIPPVVSGIIPNDNQVVAYPGIAIQMATAPPAIKSQQQNSDLKPPVVTQLPYEMASSTDIPYQVAPVPPPSTEPMDQKTITTPVVLPLVDLYPTDDVSTPEYPIEDIADKLSLPEKVEPTQKDYVSDDKNIEHMKHANTQESVSLSRSNSKDERSSIVGKPDRNSEEKASKRQRRSMSRDHTSGRSYRSHSRSRDERVYGNQSDYRSRRQRSRSKSSGRMRHRSRSKSPIRHRRSASRSRQYGGYRSRNRRSNSRNRHRQLENNASHSRQRDRSRTHSRSPVRVNRRYRSPDKSSPLKRPLSRSKSRERRHHARSKSRERNRRSRSPDHRPVRRADRYDRNRRDRRAHSRDRYRPDRYHRGRSSDRFERYLNLSR